MKAFILFAPTFLEWPLAVCETLRASEPSLCVSGLATGPTSIFQKVAAMAGIGVTPLVRLDDMEREWLATPVRQGARNFYEEKLGSDVFHRLVIADRHLGRGYVSGGETLASPLAKLAEDPEVLERYLVGLLDFAFGLLNNERPDFVFCHTVSTAPELAFALIARLVGIKLAQLRHTRIGNRVIVDTSPYDHLLPVRKRFEKILQTGAIDYRSTNDAADYLAAVRNSASTPDYLTYHTERILERLRPVPLLQTMLGGLHNALREQLNQQPQELRRPSPLAIFKHELAVALRASRLLRGGPFQPAGWRPSRPFAFFPLHVDPESSTTIQSPMHTDQLAVIEALAKNLPGNMALVVKEHIPMLGRRPIGFYERISRMPGVELASPVESGLRLVRDAALTTVISSTAGWEAMVLGRPTLIIASPPYVMVNDGFVVAPDLAKLGESIRGALGASPTSESRLLAYVNAVLHCSFECPTEVMWESVSEKIILQNPQILAALVERLQGTSETDIMVAS